MRNMEKLSVATFLGILSAYLGIATIPLILLLILMVIDYVTGIGVAWMTGTISSRKSISGILKKVGYLAVIVVGVVCDLLIEYAFAAIGQEIAASYAVGIIIMIWLILNECISVLENLTAMGVPFPGFLKGIVKHLKVATEQTVETTAKDGENNSEGENKP